MWFIFADVDVLIWEASLAAMLVLTVVNFVMLLSIWRRPRDKER